MSNQQQPSFHLAHVPGKATVQFEVVTEGQRPAFKDQNGRTLYGGILLSDLRRQIGGDRGEVVDPQAGQKLPIDLTAWADADPDKTYVVLYFEFHPDLPIAPEHKHYFPWIRS